jgi:hypothetical protein
MQDEELVRRGGLLSGLLAQTELNWLVEAFYGTLLQAEAPRGEAVTPPTLERFPKEQSQEPAAATR